MRLRFIQLTDHSPSVHLGLLRGVTSKWRGMLRQPREPLNIYTANEAGGFHNRFGLGGEEKNPCPPLNATRIFPATVYSFADLASPLHN
jgi:hypothetical protein